MINHARTLLLNMPGEYMPDGRTPGDCYIPEFNRVELGGGMLLASELLFGTDPDYVGRLYRVEQYLRILDVCGYSGRLADLDPRVTYNLTDSAFAKYPLVSTISSSSSLALGEVGDGGWDDSLGRISKVWHISGNVAGLTCRVDLSISGDPASSTVIRTQFVSGSTPAITLPGSTYSCRLRLMPSFTSGTVNWVVTCRRRPPSPGRVCDGITNMNDSVKAAVFGSPALPPFDAILGGIASHRYAVDKIGAFLYAYILRMARATA